MRLCLLAPSHGATLRLHASIQSLTHTDIQDCNKVGQDLDKRLEELGGKRIYALGEGDERTGLTEVEPWIAGLWEALASNSA